MQRILILGGGVGGTLTANLLVRRLRRRVKAGEGTITLGGPTGRHVYQPGFMYIAMGGERADRLERGERGLLDPLVTLVVGEVQHVDDVAHAVELADGQRIAYEHLVIAAGCRIVPDAIPNFDTEA